MCLFLLVASVVLCDVAAVVLGVVVGFACKPYMRTEVAEVGSQTEELLSSSDPPTVTFCLAFYLICLLTFYLAYIYIYS